MGQRPHSSTLLSKLADRMGEGLPRMNPPEGVWNITLAPAAIPTARRHPAQPFARTPEVRSFQLTWTGGAAGSPLS